MKKTFTTLLLATASITSFAQEWIDVTDMYVTNPRYDNNIYTGWMGDGLSGYNPRENAEHYNKTYNTYQEINGLPAGTYRLSLQAFYRMGTAAQDYDRYTSGNYEQYQKATLFAKSSKNYYDTRIVPLASGKREKSLGGTTKYVGNVHFDQTLWANVGDFVVPDNMEAARYWFDAGYYNNSVDCVVEKDGYLRIGIRKDYQYQDDWTCIDNWKLELWGTFVNVSSITLSKTSLTMAATEVEDLTATVMPENATYRNVTWSSTNESVAIVDSKGQVTAVGKGTCYIVATSKDGSGIEGRCQVTVENHPEDIVINEIMAANVDVYLDPSQNYGCWVELYNPTSRNIAIGGLYVSDDPENLKKCRLVNNYDALPARGFVVLNFDHHEVWTEASYRQIDGKLDCDGATIYISDGTTIYAQETFGQAISRMSWARTTDGGSTWSFTGNPSPGYSNEVNGGFAETQLNAPIVDKDAQLFEGSMQVCVNIPQGATLRYTTDGTAPTLTNGKTSTTGLFTVDNTTCFRFRLFQDGYLPSQVVTRTYIYNDRDYVFPIISVVTDDNNLNSTEYGVFKQGPNGRTGRGQTQKSNWNMEWDRPVAFEFINTETNECVVSQECDFSMCGGWSRAWTPHSFKLKATKTYDLKNFFSHQFFDKKPYLKHKTLQIRNGGNDVQGGGRLKDAMVQQVVARSGLNVDYQEWQPVHVLINGNFYATLNMREPNNKHYAYANYGIDTDEMDQFEICPDSGYIQMEGTDEAYLHLIELSKNAADEDTYKEISKLIDIDEYVNYMAVELYAGGTDWPQNNVKGFRDVHDGRFRFVLFDLDFVGSTSTPFATFFNKQYYTFDSRHGYDYSRNENIEGTRLQGEITFVTLFRNLLKNNTFRKKFIDTFSIMGGSIFQPERVSPIANEMADYMSTGVLSGDWFNPYNSSNAITGTFHSNYNSNMMAELKNCSDMQLSSVNRQAATLSANVPDARIMVNGIELPYTEFDGYLFAPITLKAVAPVGYRFTGWKTAGNSKVRQTVFNTNSKWKYYDKGALSGTAWTGRYYGDTSWKEGAGIIGYDTNNKHDDIATSTETMHSCYYFRKAFQLSSAPAEDDEFQLDYTVDDGIIVYVNGTEAGRYNMPSGTVSYDTFSSTYASGNPDTGTMTLPTSLFVKGRNVIAVEVHNNNASSTDIMWDSALSQFTTSTNNDFVSNEEEYTLPTTGAQNLTAVFEAVSEEEMLAEGIHPVRVNEVSAANSMYLNDHFKKNDWIELFNTTDDEIDIAGMYISDNVKKPKKYQVPTDDANISTIIPAHGYKVIWCDKLENKTDIHTSFKLDADGGDVMLTAEDNSYTDLITYTAHLGKQTFGRYPDGANDTYVMNIPTIGKRNMIGSYDTHYVKPEPTPDNIRSYTKEGGITMAYVDGTINVKSEDSPLRSVNIYNASGMKMATNPFSRANANFISIYVATMPRGIYIVTATTEAGDESHIKFVIK